MQNSIKSIYRSAVISVQAFIQSRRQTSDVTFCGNRAARVLFTIYPEELNKRSHGTDVTGTHSTVFTEPARTGKQENDGYSLSTNSQISDVTTAKIVRILIEQNKIN